jgi:hypothetical protein
MLLYLEIFEIDYFNTEKYLIRSFVRGDNLDRIKDIVNRQF